MTLRFTSVSSLIPLLDWTFTFTTDVAGNVHGALPAPGQFNEWIVPATPCVAPIALTDNSTPGLAPPPIFAGAASTIMVVGALSVAGSSGAYRCPAGQSCTFGGASVTVNATQGPFAGQAISGTITSLGGPAGTIGFALPVPVTQVGSNACAPQPVNVTCDGGVCLPLDNCAQLTLEIGPSAANPELPLPTIDLPIVARFAMPPTPDGGVPAGPIISLMGEDGLGVQLPIAPKQLVTVSGTVTQPGGLPGGDPLQSAEVTIACLQADGGSLCSPGYSYRETTLTGVSGTGMGGFELSVPPNGTYTITATPPPGLGLAPVSQLVAVGGSDAGVGGVNLFVPPDYLLTGTVLDPTSSFPITAGQVQATSLTTGALVGATDLGSSGGFQLSLPPGQYMLTIRPASSTGLPNFSVAEALVGDVDLGNISLYLPGRLTGGVFAEPLDGGPYPVAQASIDFYFVTENQAFGKVAVPIASGITDQEGRFSVAVPASNSESSPRLRGPRLRPCRQSPARTARRASCRAPGAAAGRDPPAPTAGSLRAPPSLPGSTGPPPGPARGARSPPTRPRAWHPSRPRAAARSASRRAPAARRPAAASSSRESRRRRPGGCGSTSPSRR